MAVNKRSDGFVELKINTKIRNEKGKWVYKSVYGKTKKEAEMKKEEFLEQLRLEKVGKSINKDSISLSDWVYKHLIINVRSNIKESSFERYVSIYNTHIKDSKIGKKPIDEISQIELQEFINHKCYLSKSSIKKIREVLRIAYKSAKTNKYVDYNPALELTVPKKEEKKVRRRVFTEDEIRIYESYLGDSTMHTMLYLLLNTGMRVGEAMALRWDKIDFENGKIAIEENLKTVRIFASDLESYEYKTITNSPKTKSGTRTILIPFYLRDRLEEYKQIASKSKEGYVFCTKNRTPLALNNISRAHKAVCKKASLITAHEEINKDDESVIKYSTLTLHGLRHTFATRAIALKMDVNTLSRHLGHASIEITLSLYVHGTEDMKEEGRRILEQAYQAKNKSS